MLYEKAKNFLGLCARAGQVIFGSDAVLRGIKAGKAQVVVLDESISEASLKRFMDKTAHYKTRVYALADIGRAVGKDNIMVIALKGDMAKRFVTMMEDARDAEINPGV